MKKFNVKNQEAQIKEEARKHSSKEKRRTTGDSTHKKWRARRIKGIKKNFPECKSVLCIGARDDSEVIDHINSGYKAHGIDVSNESSYITKLDAHNLVNIFDKDEFDVIYACHCLEHMYDADSVMRQIRTIAKMGVVITLPFGKNAITPCLGHPSIFDIMLDCPIKMSIEDARKKMDDFSPFLPFELVDFHRSKEYSEIDIYLGW